MLKLRNIDATKGKLLPSIVLYALPLILSTLIQTLFHAVDLIVLRYAADGIAVLAHPHHQTHLVGELVEFGLNGIEVSHPQLDAEMSADSRAAAEAYRLYCSGGTDHSGPMSGCGGIHAIPVFNGISEEAFRIIRERRLG